MVDESRSKPLKTCLAKVKVHFQGCSRGLRGTSLLIFLKCLAFTVMLLNETNRNAVLSVMFGLHIHATYMVRAVGGGGGG